MRLVELRAAPSAARLRPGRSRGAWCCRGRAGPSGARRRPSTWRTMRLGRGDAGLGRDQLGLLLVGIEPRQQLVLHDVLADIGQPLADLAAEAKGEVGADLGGDHAGERDGRREIDDFRGHGLDPGQRRRGAAVVLASRQKAKAEQTSQIVEPRNPHSPLCPMLSGTASSRDAHHQAPRRSSASEYAFAPEKAYGMSRGGGFRRQGGLVEVETDAGVQRHRRGVRQSVGDPRILPHDRAAVRRQERVRLRPCRGPRAQRHVPSGRRQPAHRLPRPASTSRCYDAIARGFGVRVCDLIGGCAHDAHPGLCLDRLLLQRSRPPARPHAGRGGGPSLCRRQDQDRPRHQGRRRARAPARARRWGRTSS